MSLRVIQGAGFIGWRAGIVSGIKTIAEGLLAEFKRVLPGQRKTQRDNLALLVATMLDC